MALYFLREDIFDTDLRSVQLGGDFDDTVPAELFARETWLAGTRLENVPELPVFTYDPASGTSLPDLLDFPLPLVSPRLLGMLAEAAVDSFVAHPFRFASRDPGAPALRGDYYQVLNVVRVLDAIDEARSERRGSGNRLQSIALRADVAGAAPGLFVLARGPAFMCVNEELKRALTDAGLVGVLLEPIEEYDGD
jgi:hypothetical protein